MKKFRMITIIGVMLLMGLLTGCSGSVTYSELTDVEVFQDVPILDVEGAKTSYANDYGDGNYVIKVTGTNKGDYDAYLTLLEENGFKKYVDNGDGFDGTVFNTTYTKDNLVLQVLQLEKINTTYLCAGTDNPLSKHLFYSDEYVANNIDGAKTTLHNVEMYFFGNSFIIQLKDGSFILNDGGYDYDAPYLFDYLEELAPKGEKPVITALVISHAHRDHIGWFKTIKANYSDYEGRVLIEGVYYNEPNEEVVAYEGKVDGVANLKEVITHFKTTDGKTPEIYRMSTGQRYYFNDITMDVVLTQEQLLFKDYEDGFNESSTWVNYTIEGQTFMFGGDSGPAGMKKMVEVYSKDYLTVNFFSALHHGYNNRVDFAEYITIKDVLMYSERKIFTEGTRAILAEGTKEIHSYGEGTMVYTFPYTEGTAECLGNNLWLYNQGEVRPQL